MVAIKSTEDSRAKWERRAGSASGEYEEGIKNPKKSWSKETQAAEQAYEQGVTAAISRKGFGKGVAKAGDSKWQKNAVEKGPVRYAQGVSLAGPAYAAGFAPYRAALASLELPARGPKGDPKNIARVAKVAKTLHDTKLQLKGA